MERFIALIAEWSTSQDLRNKIRSDKVTPTLAWAGKCVSFWWKTDVTGRALLEQMRSLAISIITTICRH